MLSFEFFLWLETGAGGRLWDESTQGDARVLMDYAPLGLGDVWMDLGCTGRCPCFGKYVPLGLGVHHRAMPVCWWITPRWGFGGEDGFGIQAPTGRHHLTQGNALR